GRRTRGGIGQLGKRLFFEGDDRHRVPRTTGRLEDQKWEPTVARDQSEVHHSSTSASSARRDARRRMTPREEERMNSTRYCTSGQLSVRSCSICCSARVVFSFD